MVRLKQEYAMTIKNAVLKSQFHYGSIKTEVAEIIEKINQLSQFHYGSIKTYAIWCI